MSFVSFGFGQNDNTLDTKFKKFKAEKGVNYRLGFAWWPGMEEGKTFTAADLEPAEGQSEEELTPKFLGGNRHYRQDTGYVLNKGPAYTALMGSPPKTVVATIVISWPLEKGKPTKNSLFGSMPEVMPWVISMEKYNRLKKQHMSGYPMWDWDVNVECEDAGFQKLQFLPAKNCIFKEMLKSTSDEGKAIANYIIERVRAIAPHIGNEIGKDLTLDQIREKMGQEVSAPVADSGAVGEVEDLIGSMLDD